MIELVDLFAILSIVMCEATLCVMVAIHAEMHDKGEGKSQ